MIYSTVESDLSDMLKYSAPGIVTDTPNTSANFPLPCTGYKVPVFTCSVSLWAHNLYPSRDEM